MKDGGYQFKLIELQSLSNETSKSIKDYIITTLNNKGIAAKSIAFGGDNTNTNFGGVARNPGNNIFTKLKTELKCGEKFIGIGSPAHILNTAVHTAADVMNIDVESVIMKIYNFFSIYTVRVHTLMEFCEFVGVGYQDLLFHSKTRWLSLFPAIERLLQAWCKVLLSIAGKSS